MSECDFPCGVCSRFNDCSFDILASFRTKNFSELENELAKLTCKRADLADDVLVILRERASDLPATAEAVESLIGKINQQLTTYQKLSRVHKRVRELLKSRASDEEILAEIRRGPEEAGLVLVELMNSNRVELLQNAFILCKSLAEENGEYRRVVIEFLIFIQRHGAQIVIKGQPVHIVCAADITAAQEQEESDEPALNERILQ